MLYSCTCKRGWGKNTVLIEGKEIRCPSYAYMPAHFLYFLQIFIILFYSVVTNLPIYKMFLVCHEKYAAIYTVYNTVIYSNRYLHFISLFIIHCLQLSIHLSVCWCINLFLYIQLFITSWLSAIISETSTKVCRTNGRPMLCSLITLERKAFLSNKNNYVL